MALVLKHQSLADFVQRFREAYRNSERERCVQLGRWLLARIQAGDLTDAQCRTAFGMTSSQWTNAKNRMTARINAHNTIRSAVGE